MKYESVSGKNCGIYAIYNIYNGKIYIGSALDMTRRYNKHIRTLILGTHHNGHLQSAWNNDGEDAFVFFPILFCEKDEVKDKEQWWIDFYKSYDNRHGYNISRSTIAPMLGRRHSDESRLSMSKSRKGVPHTKEGYKKIGDSQKGRKFSEERIVNMSEIAKSMWESEEYRERQKIARVGRLLSVEHKENLGASRRGRKRSDNSSGFVCVSKQHNKWIYRFAIRGNLYRSGGFNSAEEANAACLSLRANLGV